ncbi:hypothetical protein [Sorangium sp. So ce388]|uniref:hypothetical protein n=1 Tax=Sorangium sp. So ce388 TaxID=3133309 RepID=UPI003F5B17DD
MSNVDHINEMRVRYKQELEAFYGVAVDSLSYEKVKVWFGLSHGLCRDLEARTVEIDVTPRWWVPVGESADGVRKGAMADVLWAWVNDGSRFGEALRAHHVRGVQVMAYPDRVAVAFPAHIPADRPFCDALLDRLSHPGVEGKVLGRMALMSGEGDREEKVLPGFGAVVITSRRDTSEALVEWSDARTGTRFQNLLKNDADRALFGLEPAARPEAKPQVPEEI